MREQSDQHTKEHTQSSQLLAALGVLGTRRLHAPPPRRTRSWPSNGRSWTQPTVSPILIGMDQPMPGPSQKVPPKVKCLFSSDFPGFGAAPGLLLSGWAAGGRSEGSLRLPVIGMANSQSPHPDHSNRAV